jgi:hypothetical protein
MELLIEKRHLRVPGPENRSLSAPNRSYLRRNLVLQAYAAWRWSAGTALELAGALPCLKALI